MKHTLSLLLLAVAATLSAAQATYRETMMPLTTYMYSDPTPVPSPESVIYPYFRFDAFDKYPTKREWKVIELENPYIKLAVMPQIGGKIWSAIDKTNNEEFIYGNSVVKFRDIAMRGAWTSGGIEMNFGLIGHVPTTATPIDYLATAKPDGSVSCYLSAYEWMTSTWWMVEVNLPADKAYFTTRTTWHNTSDLTQPYYQWMNAAYAAEGNARFYFGGTHAITHDGKWDTYPVLQDGHDISYYSNAAYGADKSYHVLGADKDFYGVYWHDKSFGSVHYAPYADKLGRKIFLWSQSRSGGIWEDLLTDNDGQYVELQSGRMFHQPYHNSAYTPFKHTAFAAQATDTWTEYWYPVKDTEGMVKSNDLGTLNILRTDKQLDIYFCPLQTLDTRLQVWQADSLLTTLPMQTDVLQTWHRSLPFDTTAPVTIVIGNNDFVYSEQEETAPMLRPVEAPADFDWQSVYGLATEAEQFMYQKQYQKAEQLFLQSLSKQPYYLPALQAMAELCYRKGQFDKSLDYCLTALSLNTYDGKANYIYGLCCQQQKDYLNAKDAFSIAARDLAWQSAAYQRLAEVYFAEQRYNQAEQFALRAIHANQQNLTAHQLLSAVRRRTSQPADLQNILQEAPLYHGLRYEAYLAGILTEDDFRTAIRNEMPEQVYVHLSQFYERIGAWEEAEQLLSFASAYPIANYCRAYLLATHGNLVEAHKLLQQTNAQSPAFVYPHRIATLPALQWAAQESADWQPRYYMALVWLANGQREKALSLLETCNEACFAPLYLLRARLKEDNAALHDLKRAEQIEASWRTGVALIEYYNGHADFEQAVQTGRRYVRKYPYNYYLGLPYAKALCKSGKYKDCIAYLQQLEVLPYEGTKVGRTIYRNACLLQAIEEGNKANYKTMLRYIDRSRLWLENLGVGKPYDDMIDTRTEDYLQAQALLQLQQTEEARSLLLKVKQYRHMPDPHAAVEDPAAIYCQQIAAEPFNKEILDTLTLLIADFQ